MKLFWYKRVRRWRCGLARPDGGTRKVYVAILVLEAFRGSRPDGMLACHNDGDSSNDRLSNLRWATPKGNAEDSRLHGTLACGERSGRSKLTEDGVRLVRKTIAAGLSVRKTGKLFGVSHSTVHDIARGKHWRHVLD